MKLFDLMNSIYIYSCHSEDNPEITSMEMDSRQVTPGSLFVCVRGLTVDGHQFAKQAVDNGAVAILAEEELDVNVPVVIVNDTKRAMALLADCFYEQPSQNLHLIGITGTNGKTTTSHLIDHIFNEHGQKTGLIGTINMKIDEEITKVTNTTPESLILQKAFHRMVERNVETAVMEVSSHALDYGRVRGCDYNVAVFTNLSQDHLDYHETMEEYKKAKGLLFSQLGNAYDEKKPKFAVLNIDDEASRYFEKITAAEVITYGIKNKADVRAENIKLANSGTTFELVTPKGKKVISMKMIGMFNVYNVLAATTAALVSGVPFNRICSAIESMEGVSGRFEVVDEGQPFTVIVDFAHTPDSLENVLSTVKQFAENNITVVVGCGGDRDKLKRPLMAKIAVDYADVAIFTSDNPRTEDPNEILKDMEAGIESGTYKTIVDRRDAIRYAIRNATNRDVIIIAGKGHETYQQIGNQTFDFDDRLEARNAIKERIK